MKKAISRVDVQVSIMTTLIVLISSIFVGTYSYIMTYNSALHSLENRTFCIYDEIEEEFDMSTFDDINTKEDVTKEKYVEAKDYLTDLRDTAGVLYLYTAKVNDEGEFIYVIDGLEEEGDFRYPGDPIEVDIVPDMKRALSGENVLPENIKETDWGDIFITYLPVHDEAGNIVGVVGVEFDAKEIKDTYARLQVATVIIIFAFCVVGMVVSYLIFRRISNPNFRDKYNVDQLTKLKNRNAFETDIENIEARGKEKDLAIIVIDIDNLKMVNDTKGHDMGDKYIIATADCLSENAEENMVVYRIGGDEFIVIVRRANEKQVLNYIEKCKEYVFDLYEGADKELSFSCGYAMQPKGRADIYYTYKEADEDMYKNKRNFSENKEFDLEK